MSDVEFIYEEQISGPPACTHRDSPEAPVCEATPGYHVWIGPLHEAHPDARTIYVCMDHLSLGLVKSCADLHVFDPAHCGQALRSWKPGPGIEFYFLGGACIPSDTTT